MRQIKSWTLTLMLAVLLAAPLSATACPICSEGIQDSSSGDEDADDFPNAMNQSIYLMVSVPYIALGFAGFFIYRGCKQNENQGQAGD